MYRRDLMKLCASATMLALVPSIGRGASDDKDYEDYDGPLPGPWIFGRDPATDHEEQRSQAILSEAPRGKSLIETIKYFEAITEKNAQEELYKAQWKVRWNPVIVGFYRSTTLDNAYVTKNGDTIPWCAAFVNWCLACGGYETTGSPMSGSFGRIEQQTGLGKPTNNPKPGDIIVFRNRNSKEAELGFGHVGVFIKETLGGWSVLGGNQHAKKKYSSVNTTVFAKDHGTLVLDSFRSIDTIPRKG